MSIKCAECGSENPGIATYCQKCGNRLDQSGDLTPSNSSKNLLSNIKGKIEDYQENQRKIEHKKEQRRKEKFLDGTAKMIVELPSKGYSGAARAGATLALGIIGYAATKGGKTKDFKVKVKVMDEKISLNGQINTEINYMDITNTMYQSKPPKLIIKFKDGSSINFKRLGDRISYPSILNIMIENRLNKIIFETREEQTSKVENPSSIDEIKKAKGLLDIGAISEEEFEKIKNKVINRL